MNMYVGLMAVDMVLHGAISLLLLFFFSLNNRETDLIERDDVAHSLQTKYIPKTRRYNRNIQNTNQTYTY